MFLVWNRTFQVRISTPVASEWLHVVQKQKNAPIHLLDTRTCIFAWLNSHSSWHPYMCMNMYICIIAFINIKFYPHTYRHTPVLAVLAYVSPSNPVLGFERSFWGEAVEILKICAWLWKPVLGLGWDSTCQVLYPVLFMCCAYVC